MLKRFTWLIIATAFFFFQTVAGNAYAAQIDVATRTIPLNDQGDTIVVSMKQLADGKRLFNSACSRCHLGGVTKTDPNVGLDPEALDLATPPRNTVESLVGFLKSPMTYDGVTDISDIHPSKKSADIFPVMRNLTDKDLVAISAHILTQPKIIGEQWGGGKALR
jgi:photosystem II cytochrome c550